MIKYIKQELDLSPTLERKINWAKNYTKINIRVEKGHLIKLEPTNIAYVDPHKVFINEKVFLFFNGVDSFYVDNLNNKHNFSELENLFKLATKS